MTREHFGNTKALKIYPVLNGPATKEGKVTDDLATVGLILNKHQVVELITALAKSLAGEAPVIDITGNRHTNTVTVTGAREDMPARFLEPPDAVYIDGKLVK